MEVWGFLQGTRQVRGRCRKGTCDMGLWVADVSVAFVAHVMDVSGILLRVAHAF